MEVYMLSKSEYYALEGFGRVICTKDYTFKTKGINNPTESARVLSLVIHGALLHYACADNADDLRLMKNTVIKNILKNGI
jgi:hypothetical protein